MDTVIDELTAMTERLQVLRSKHSPAKNAGDPSYHALSAAISQIRRAVKAFEAAE